MTYQQILENLLNFSMQQHIVKDKQIEDLQAQATALQKQLATLQEMPSGQK